MNKGSMHELKRALERHGLRIEPAAFVCLVARALDEQPALLFGPSITELSAAERAELEAGGFDLTQRQRKGGGPLDRSFADHAALIATSITVARAAQRLAIHPSSVRRMLKRGALYGFQRHRSWLLPAFQFSGRRALPGLDRVLPAIPEGQHPLAISYFFLTPQDDLRHPESDEEMSPREWLLLGLPPEPIIEFVGALGVA